MTFIVDARAVHRYSLIMFSRNDKVILPDNTKATVAGFTSDGWIIVAQGNRRDEFQTSQLKKAP